MTEEHLTFRQIEEYRAKRLGGDGILALYRHVDACPACRDMLVQTVVGSNAEHLAEQQAVNYIAGRLSGAERVAVEQHRANCVPCAAMLSDLKAFRNGAENRLPSESPQAGWNYKMWAIPIAAALVLALGISLWKTTGRGLREQPVVASLRDQDGVLQWNAASGLREGTAPWDDRFGKLVASSLRTGQLPAGPKDSAPETRGTLRGEGEAAPALDIISPDGVRVMDNRPEFVWLAMEGVSHFRVTVTDDQFRVVARSPLLDGTRWISDRELPRGRRFSWQVTAERRGEKVIAPVPPAPASRFEIITENFAKQIMDAQKRKPLSHLLLANVYAEAGMRREAELETKAILNMNRGSALARSLYESAIARH